MLDEMTIVRAHDGAGGRETVADMARRSGANVAINGGYFEIGGKIDGKPSATLVVEGKTHGLKAGEQPLLQINKGVLSISQKNPKEILLHHLSLLWGTPLLVSKGRIPTELEQKKSDFYLKNQARTAVGVRKDGTVILIVAEHTYKRDLTEITLGEVQSLVKERQEVLAQKYGHANPGDLKLSELKIFLKEEFNVPDGVQGVSIPDLAQLMVELRCEDAINLDGGGSSTLWIEGKMMNQPIGDLDEANGVAILRPVSDAIMFKISPE